MPFEATFAALAGTPDRSGVSVVDSATPVYRFDIWWQSSLRPEGFVWFIGITALMLSLPLFALLGTPAVWGILPFVLMALVGLWWGLARNRKVSQVSEKVSVWPDLLTVERTDAKGNRSEWSASPYWVRARLHQDQGPVPDYLTLRGNNHREIELGAFLSQAERLALHAAVSSALDDIRQSGPSTPPADGSASGQLN